jgi:hypothetical protein
MSALPPKADIVGDSLMSALCQKRTFEGCNSRVHERSGCRPRLSIAGSGGHDPRFDDAKAVLMNSTDSVRDVGNDESE